MNTERFSGDMLLPMDEEEAEIMDAFKEGNIKVSRNSDQEAKTLAHAAANSLAKRQQISIRVKNGDLYALKAEAEEAGIGYQTLISSIVHRHVKERSFSR